VLGVWAAAGAAASRPTTSAPAKRDKKEYFFMRKFEKIK
jgi:hypothetical protein